ncbi:single-stranded DNA-binding protein [Nakamurella flava]|nr:single-stranded DNA-binding protein [Nakamurella flava]
MNAAEVRLAGRVTAHPTVSLGERGDRVTFRILSTERRFVPDTREWVDGDQFGVTVVCWGQLATSVIGLVRKGDPVIVIGRISSRQFERSTGGTDYWTDIRADAVALDLGRGGAGRWMRRPIAERSGGDERVPGDTGTADHSGGPSSEDWADQLESGEPPADSYDGDHEDALIATARPEPAVVTG